LKSSLKCSRGRRVIVSEPATPPSSKSVRFKDSDGELESVCFFRATGRPYSISHPRSHSDTETETDNTDSAPTTTTTAAARRGSQTTFTVAEISPIPSPQTPPESNVCLESIALLPARPPFLRGIVRVRNIAFEKSVSARFTTDAWTTVSEAQARYVGPDHAGDWDLFTFTIPLEAPPLQPRTLLLAVRYSVPGNTAGNEWWDNNGGADFRVLLAPKSPPPPRPP
ncbi:putative phosphatase regulatory subunit-domain-containing protein, partial [Lactarius indigo]